MLLAAWQQSQSPGAVHIFLGLSYSTVSRWYKRFAASVPRDTAHLIGAAEVDQAFFARQKFEHQTIVLGMRGRMGGVRLKVVSDREGPTLTHCIQENRVQEVCFSPIHTKATSMQNGWAISEKSVTTQKDNSQRQLEQKTSGVVPNGRSGDNTDDSFHFT